MKNFLRVLIKIEAGAVGRVVALPAIGFINAIKLFAGMGVAFCWSMAGFTLNIFESGFPVLGSTVAGGVARQAGRVESLLFFDQGIVGPGVGGCRPVFVLARMTGLASLFPNDGPRGGS